MNKIQTSNLQTRNKTGYNLYWSKLPQIWYRDKYPWKVSEKNIFESFRYEKGWMWFEKVGNWRKFCTILVLILCCSTENFDNFFSYSLRFLLKRIARTVLVAFQSWSLNTIIFLSKALATTLLQLLFVY